MEFKNSIIPGRPRSAIKTRRHLNRRPDLIKVIQYHLPRIGTGLDLSKDDAVANTLNNMMTLLSTGAVFSAPVMIVLKGSATTIRQELSR